MTIYTVGYEGCDIDEFVAGLVKNKIKRIIDIRRNPVSRKKGFSKNKLAAELQKVGIEYSYLGKELGVPSAWRKAAKEHLITRKKMFNDYKTKILPKHPKQVEEVIELSSKRGRSALLCYENEATDCHRHYLTEKIKTKLPETKVKDINVLPKTKSLGLAKS
ncbi:DUF488 domain-containing protein [Bdellovibrio sp. SKB1291214]|uniref:DUF488 domain-containing protein n=1 Tax=Bdellovibrio sp. SKB1291214 TaxID=1732569 RepID=UPI001594FAA2|nr:DUF488 domain-containing protein [Bdellovibrio sp. SKB1291214]UYL09690.1 DUF488 domain-containing protein [Bdellovibrio sp. SKB1291214]